MMEKYRDLSGNSGVTAYEFLEDGIVLQFGGEEFYLYDYLKPGKDHVENMKVLAEKGVGLTTYVNQNVRENYRRKW